MATATSIPFSSSILMPRCRSNSPSSFSATRLDKKMSSRRYRRAVIVAAAGYYSILEVPKSASGKDIKAAYRKFASGPPGDHFVYLDIEEIPEIQRDGTNLYSSVSVSYLDAIFGTVIEVMLSLR